MPDQLTRRFRTSHFRPIIEPEIDQENHKNGKCGFISVPKDKEGLRYNGITIFLIFLTIPAQNRRKLEREKRRING